MRNPQFYVLENSARTASIILVGVQLRIPGGFAPGKAGWGLLCGADGDAALGQVVLGFANCVLPKMKD